MDIEGHLQQEVIRTQSHRRMVTKDLPSLVERYLSQASYFAPTGTAPLPWVATKLNFQPEEHLFGVWRAPGLRDHKVIIISSLGVWGWFDIEMVFVPYAEISDLRIPDPDDPSDAERNEIMLFTREAKCIFFPLFDSERDHREAAILFQCLSSVVSLHARADFIGG